MLVQQPGIPVVMRSGFGVDEKNEDPGEQVVEDSRGFWVGMLSLCVELYLCEHLLKEIVRVWFLCSSNSLLETSAGFLLTHP